MKQNRPFIACVMLVYLFISIPHFLFAQKMMEYLNRGVVATVSSKGNVLVSWRLLGTEDTTIQFNLYKKTGDKSIVQINKKPIHQTNFLDENVDTLVANTYTVIPVLKGKEQSEKSSFILPAFPKPYISIPLKTPIGYTPNDIAVGDVDGDGIYEIIIHQTGRGRDNASAGFTDPPIFQAYKLDGTFLWEINLGKNIREGAHYTQFMVYDLDGDGKTEIAMKTADGTIDGLGKIIGDSSKDYRAKGDRRTEGKILDGPEYFTIFSGLTGAELATTNYIAPRGNIGGWGGVGGNGGNDNTGNRVDRFTACIAYLDGKLPSVVMGRGYYGRTVLAAWDWRNGKLSSRWVFDSEDGKNPFSGQGYHNLSVADVDNDGKDEIVFGSMCVDDNGKGLYSTGLRHGDALHVSDLDPSLPGLEVYGVHEIEEGTKGFGTAMYQAKNGTILFAADENKDIGRGVAADIDPRYDGAENWGGESGLKSCKGEKIGNAPRSVNFIVQWDESPIYELLNGTRIEKWNYETATLETLFDAKNFNCASNNGTKANPAISADILGDWREEVIYRTTDNKELRIFSTTIPTSFKLYTLMHNPHYRVSVAWQNVGYNQPPHTDFFFGANMKMPAKPNIVVPKSK